MRCSTAVLLGITLALPLSVTSVPARADTDNNSFMSQAQRFLNGRSGQADRDAYDRGRQDELRRDRAERDREYRRAEAERNEWREREGWRRDQNSYNNGYRPEGDYRER